MVDRALWRFFLLVFMIHWLDAHTPFPEAEAIWGADSEAPGLAAISEGITVDQLLRAYKKGFFPWYSAGQPVLWWNPDPRMVLYTGRFKISKSLRKILRTVLRNPAWEIKVDADFAAVMEACAYTPREAGSKDGLAQMVLHTIQRAKQEGKNIPASDTWITPQIQAAYGALHVLGHAHSVETWYQGQRVGGLYGVNLGKTFFGESMFAWRAEASKIALAALVSHLRRQNVALLDCQQRTAHLASLGGEDLPREDFLLHLEQTVYQSPIEWGFGKEVLGDLV